MRVVFCKCSKGALAQCRAWENQIEIDLSTIKLFYRNRWRRIVIVYFFHELTHYLSYKFGFADWRNPEKLYKEELLCAKIHTLIATVLHCKTWATVQQSAQLSTKALFPNWNPPC